MDPNLWELLAEGGPADEVAAVLRLREAGVYPAAVRVVAEFASIVTCRLTRASIPSVRDAPAVASMKAARALVHDVGLEMVPDLEDLAPRDERRAEGLTETGRGVVIGVVDWGVDFAQPAFRRPDGSTRLLALWDQRGGETAGSNPYGYGRIFSAADIDSALRTADPYAALGYHPADADPGDGTHGTHVLDIAAGNGGGGGPVGIAPQTELVFVHLASQRHEELDTLGDSVTLLEALDFITHVAPERPRVVNLSLGNHGGPHDGSTLVEQALDEWLRGGSGRALCQSTGNYLDRGTHTALHLRPDAHADLLWQTDAADRTPNELEIWYPAGDRLTVRVTAPTGEQSAVVPLGGRDTMMTAGRDACRIYHRAADPNNGDHLANVFLHPGAPAGVWTVSLFGEDVIDGRIHAWIERDEGCPNCQSRFAPGHAAAFSTTGTICNGRRTIAVGAFDAHSPDRSLAPFSSMGPTRDGRQKPDLCAPGVRVLAARSTSRESSGTEPPLVRKSGTSMAAPHVTGCVALMFEAAGRPLAIEETRRLLLGTASRPPDIASEDAARLGSGYWNPERAVAAARNLTGTARLPQEATRCCDDAEKTDDLAQEISELTTPDEMEGDSVQEGDVSGLHVTVADGSSDALLRELRAAELYDGLATAARPDLRKRWSHAFEVIAAPGESLVSDLQPGDVLVRRARGEGGLAHVAVLATGEIVAHENASSGGLQTEARGPGLYVQVLEASPRPRRLADGFARRVADSLGRVGPDQIVLRPLRAHHPVETPETPAERFPTEWLRPSPEILLPTVVEVIDRGDAQFEWWGFNVESKGYIAVFYTFVDALRDKKTGLRLPCRAAEAQQAADRIRVAPRDLAAMGWYQPPQAEALPSLLLTPKLMDMRWASAAIQNQTVEPCTEDVAGLLAEESRKLNACVSKRIKAGWWVADPGKIWALTNNLGGTRGGGDTAVNYGWHVHPSKVRGGMWRGIHLERTGTTAQWVIQGPHTKHHAYHIDYSQILLLVAGWCQVIFPGEQDPRTMKTAEVYRSKELAHLVSYGGVPLQFTRQPFTEAKLREETGMYWDKQEKLYRQRKARARAAGGRSADALPELRPPDQDFLAWVPGRRADSRFPRRPASAPAGREFLRQIWGDREPNRPGKWNEREAAIRQQLVDGNMPDFLTEWKAVTVRDGTRTGTIWVLPDDLCIGSDQDFVHIPMDAITAQRVADAFSCLLPTAKMCHDIYLQADRNHRLTAIQYSYWKTDPPGQASTAAYQRHSLAIQKQMQERGIQPGELVAGHKKEVVIAAGLDEPARRTKLSFYGFYDATGIPIQGCYSSKTGQPIPGCAPGRVSLAHFPHFSDYSQGVRLVRPEMVIDGRLMSVADVLADRTLHKLLSYEGIVTVPRIPAAGPGRVPKASPGISSESVRSAEAPAVETEERTEYGGRPFTPVAWPFRCAPDPPVVRTATLLPSPSTNPEADARQVLRDAGLGAGQIDRFVRLGGLSPLLPFAEFLGGECLAEVLARLRYPPGLLANPPYAIDSPTGIASLGVRSRQPLLAPRLLLAIPGHFRELARRASAAREAYALENLGWLLAELLRDRVRQATGRDWWLPSRPGWTGRFPALANAGDRQEVFGVPHGRPPRLPSRIHDYSLQLSLLISSAVELLDPAGTKDALLGRERQWSDSLAGRQWGFETGQVIDPATVTVNPGLPFYARVRGAWPPPPIEPVRAIAARLNHLWAIGTGDRRAIRPKFDREMAPAEWGGLEVMYEFPRLRGAGVRHPLKVLTPLAGHFTLLYQTVRELGWNDLFFQSSGAYAFRPVRGTVTNMSNHAAGLAIDINAFENPRVEKPPDPWRPGWGALDPRIVALFEFFGFRWGRSICPKSDPMHFEFWLRADPPPSCGGSRTC